MLSIPSFFKSLGGLNNRGVLGPVVTRWFSVWPFTTSGVGSPLRGAAGEPTAQRQRVSPAHRQRHHGRVSRAARCASGGRRGQGRGRERGHERERGSVLVMTFWLLLVTGAVLLGLNRVATVSLVRGRGELEKVKARWLARAAIEKGIEQLVGDETDHDAMSDSWYHDSQLFENIELVQGSGDTYSLVAPASRSDDTDYTAFRYGMDDAASRINANAANAGTLNRLPESDPLLTAALLDWRDGDNAVRPGGAERQTYDALTYPYEVRNGPLRTHAELRLLDGMTDLLYFGEDINQNGILDPAEDDGSPRWPEDNADGVLDPGWAGFLTVYSYALNQDLLGSPRINLAEADAAQLQTTFGFSEALIEALQEEQNGLDDVFDLIGIRGEGQADPQANEVNEITIEWIAQNWEQITVEDDERLPGQVNINTAPREALEAMQDLPDTAMERLLSVRAEQGGLTSVGELFSQEILNEMQFRRFAPLATVKSNVFLARGVGTTAGGARHEIVAVIDRGEQPLKILYWYE